MELTCVVPAYNEESRLGETLRRVTEYLDSESRDYEIIVVDDGSADATVTVASAHAAQSPRCRVVSLGKNSGKGAAVRRGVLEARGDLILFTDADLSTPIQELDRLAGAIVAGADVAIGSRALPDSRVEVHQPWVRERMGKTFNLLIRMILMRGFGDTQCGFKLFRAPVARDLFRRARLNRFAFDVEILFLAKLVGYAVVEVPVRWINSPATRVRMLRDSSRMLCDLLRIRLFQLRGCYRR
ncbi:MAG: dolichyl-phosphate beta-glucosyltransferase [Acidobacteriota bacterium]